MGIKEPWPFSKYEYTIAVALSYQGEWVQIKLDFVVGGKQKRNIPFFYG